MEVSDKKHPSGALTNLSRRPPLGQGKGEEDPSSLGLRVGQILPQRPEGSSPPAPGVGDKAPPSPATSTCLQPGSLLQAPRTLVFSAGALGQSCLHEPLGSPTPGAPQKRNVGPREGLGRVTGARPAQAPITVAPLEHFRVKTFLKKIPEIRQCGVRGGVGGSVPWPRTAASKTVFVNTASGPGVAPRGPQPSLPVPLLPCPLHSANKRVLCLHQEQKLLLLSVRNHPLSRQVLSKYLWR